MLRRIEHVQLAMPPGGEDAARGFDADLLGLSEVAKPESLRARGGCWFGRGEVRVHLGIEEPFRPARKAHPAFVVEDLEALRARLAGAGVAVADDDGLPGFRRAYASDPFGNRIELMEEA